jgi:hypothetical protein
MVTRRPPAAHQPGRNARSPQERNARSPQEQRSSLAWSALIVVASLVGGLAAAAITKAVTSAVLLSLVVAAIGVVALYFGLLNDKQPASGQHASGPGGYRVPDVPPTAPLPMTMTMPESPGDGTRPVQPAEPVRPAAVRVVSDPSTPAWWQGQGQGSAGPARRGAPSTGPRSVPLSEFLDQALIAQCPRCGSFRVGADNRPAEWHFGCEECGARWTWQPGSPWPAVQVRPNARRRAD